MATRQDYHAQRRLVTQRLADAAHALVTPDHTHRRGAVEDLREMIRKVDALAAALSKADEVLADWPADADAAVPDLIYDVQTTDGEWLARFANRHMAVGWAAVERERRVTSGHIEVREVAR